MKDRNNTSDRSKLAVQLLYCNSTKAFENIFIEATSVCKHENIKLLELGNILDLWEIWKLWCQWTPITSNHLSIICYPMCKMRNQDFKQDMLVGGFFLKFQCANKNRAIQCVVVVQWGNLLSLVYFFLISCKNNTSILIWGHVQNISSPTVAIS